MTIYDNRNLIKHLKQHNSGYGSSSLSYSYCRSYALPAYITGLYGMSKSGREMLEKWKEYQYRTIQSREHSLGTCIKAERRFVHEHNEKVSFET